MIGRLRILPLAAAALALAAPGAASAAPAWHAVAPPIEDFPSSNVAVRFDPLGTTFAFWTGAQAQLATRPSAGAFGVPGPFATSSSLPSAFGFGANGDGVFVGTPDGRSVTAAFRPAGADSAFGSVQTVASGGLPAVAVNANGQALAAWGPQIGSSSGALSVASRPAGAAGSFASESLAGVGSPQVSYDLGLIGYVFAALDADGSGVVVYRDAGPGGGTLQAIARANDGRWSGPSAIGAPAGAVAIGFATDTAGDAIVTWSEGETVRAAVRPHDGAFGGAQTVASEGGRNTLSATSVAMAADGTALIGLERHTPGRFICSGRTSQIYTAELARRSSGSWSIVSRQEGHSATVAASPTGDRVVFAWEGFVDPCVDGAHAINAQLGTLASLDGGTVLPDQPAQPPTVDGNFNSDPSVAIDGAGNAIVTWSARRPPNGGDKLRVAAFDTGSAPPGGGGGGGGGGTGGGGSGGASGGSGGGGDTGGSGSPTGPDFRDLLGLRTPVRTIPVDLASGLPTNVFVDARCIARASRCEINANGVITGSYRPARVTAARRRARAVSFTIVLPSVRATIRAGKTARLKLTIKGRALSKVRSTLRAHGSAKLTIALSVNGRRAPKPIAIGLVAKRATGRGR